MSAPWWQGAVIYQVYIRSFCDGNGDGQGDFAGLLSKLDYIAGLGVDAVWLSPIHPSPNRDWGYDVSDYNGIHPDYGTEADFDRLLAKFHARGLKVLTDEVLAHTSDEHPWFLESLKRGAKSDWYVWADPKIDGTVPNNWLSAFAGPAWSYQPARRQYYHHKFLRQQPKLNWRDPQAKAAALAVLDYWLNRGVDGFRLDVANAFLHDPTLTNNPPVPLEQRRSHHWAHAPNQQYHFNDSNLPEGINVLDEVRRIVDSHADRFVMGEFSEEPERSGTFAASDEGLHSGYSFPLLEARRLEPGFIKNHFAMLAQHPRHWPSVAFSNHDVMRTVSRFGGKHPPEGLPKLMLSLLMALRGTVLVYQGEELGLPQADVSREQIRDPVGDLYYPYTFGRDGCRTPMPWDGRATNLGFGSGTPWLPPSSAHAPLSVARQESVSNSTLAYFRRLVSARKESQAMKLGAIDFLDAPEPILVFERRSDAEVVVCAFNLGVAPMRWRHESLLCAKSWDIGTGRTSLADGELTLGSHAAWFGRL